ncbi:MAG: heat-inducible transcriptional repressor HrcA [Pseudomonadota bacterium]|nr:heat-inducible transcriptional repressor HrcA [Pseudomonadota bacterium]
MRDRRQPNALQMPVGETLSPRAREVLRLLVERHIASGKPVGSRTLVETGSLDVSPATVRSVLSDLEAEGYLRAPHTSAGRVPTEQAYRLYVDELLAQGAVPSSALGRLRRALDMDMPADRLVQAVGKLLSDEARLAGLVTLPRTRETTLRHVEFLPLSDQRVLVILVLGEREVQNRVISTERDHSAQELQQAANYLNHHFLGTPLEQIRQRLRSSLDDDQRSIDRLQRALLLGMVHAFVDPEPPDLDYVVAGEAHLLSGDHLDSVERARELFDAVHRKRQILYLLDRSLDAPGIQLHIGREAGHRAFAECAVLTAPYTRAGVQAGVVGVIGPARMPYQRIIPLVDAAAQLLDDSLNH